MHEIKGSRKQGFCYFIDYEKSENRERRKGYKNQRYKDKTIGDIVYCIRGCTYRCTQNQNPRVKL